MSGIHNKSIYSDLVNEFNQNGHEVHVMYAREKRYSLQTESYTENGIHYLGIRTGNITKNQNFVNKGISTLTIDTHFKNAYKKYWRDKEFDLVLFSTPPITVLKTLKFLKKENQNTVFYLMLKDIFPQNAIDIELISSKGLISKYFSYKEHKLYNFFDRIGTMSEKNKSYLLSKHPYLVSKVEVLPNAIAIEEDSNLGTRKEFGLPEDKVLLFYGGNLGLPQGLDFFVECMESLRYHPDCAFVIAGSGGNQDTILDYINYNKLDNIYFLGQISEQKFRRLTQVCDIGLIFLDYRFTIPNFPQRILSYMEASLPVICATDPNTDIGEIAEDHNYGYSVMSNDVKTWNFMAKKLIRSAELREEMGSNGYKHLLHNYTSEHAYKIIVSSIEKE